jgi:anhydro-N-acetylmuramic acid kinase
MLDDPFFRLTGPRSTGRELFNADWLHRQLADTHTTELRPVDVQATLRELTAQSIARSLPESVERVVVCGGGAFNAHLLQSLATALGNTSVVSSGDVGLPAMEVEAAAFAWLAELAMNGRPGNLVSVTGAAGPRILGAIYPA